MFDDITYLKLFVSKDEPWDIIIKEMYTKKLSKKEVQNRIGFAVYNGMLGKVDSSKGQMWVSYCNTFPQYQTDNWVDRYNEIKEYDEKIVNEREALVSVEYLLPEEIRHSSRALWVANFLVDTWSLSDEDAYEELYVYGILAIEEFVKNKQYPTRKLNGRYHFVRALHKYADTNNMDLLSIKTRESKWYVSN